MPPARPEGSRLNPTASLGFSLSTSSPSPAPPGAPIPSQLPSIKFSQVIPRAPWPTAATPPPGTPGTKRFPRSLSFSPDFFFAGRPLAPTSSTSQHLTLAALGGPLGAAPGVIAQGRTGRKRGIRAPPRAELPAPGPGPSPLRTFPTRASRAPIREDPPGRRTGWQSGSPALVTGSGNRTRLSETLSGSRPSPGRCPRTGTRPPPPHRAAFAPGHVGVPARPFGGGDARRRPADGAPV